MSSVKGTRNKEQLAVASLLRLVQCSALHVLGAAGGQHRAHARTELNRQIPDIRAKSVARYPQGGIPARKMAYFTFLLRYTAESP